MAEYIEREATIDEIEGATWYHISCQKILVEGAECEADALYKATDIYNAIKSVPTADVQEIKHGEWKSFDSEDTLYGSYYCTACGYGWDIGMVFPLTTEFKYCPNCGAKMDGGTNDDSKKSVRASE